MHRFHNAHSPKIGSVVATLAAPRGDPSAGKIKAAACAGCHGAEGVSEALPGPTLAGQNEFYFIEAFNAYSIGARDNPMMSAVATGAGAEDTANLAAYFTGLKCESRLAPERQAVSEGDVTASRCIASTGQMERVRITRGRTSSGCQRATLSRLCERTGEEPLSAMMAGIAGSLSDTDIEDRRPLRQRDLQVRAGRADVLWENTKMKEKQQLDKQQRERRDFLSCLGSAIACGARR